jgi:hypothetical protein
LCDRLAARPPSIAAHAKGPKGEDGASWDFLAGKGSLLLACDLEGSTAPVNKSLALPPTFMLP